MGTTAILTQVAGRISIYREACKKVMRKIFIGFIFIFIACREEVKQAQEFSISIEEPLISEIPTDSYDIKIAVDRIVGLLRSKNAPIDSLYLKNYQTDSIPWTFQIQHYTTFVYEFQWAREQERVDSLLKVDSTECVEYKMIPATGNISGYDRWIEYFPETGDINDYPFQ
ncbi:hypothetical protein J0A68_10375 [Algoriphagus sp. H41]|uniref:Lipoprotein n=1 Tax=Algoriphagus oliviformis TaxID=2811231 RepID=A0ABS3C5D7_9BACT|nr:hypothetical protein [Algoriphagus oliviformis]MBN7811366.1 hypothetical protein [Algoriphagus oliviformis]